jgi:hypothetical protein
MQQGGAVQRLLQADDTGFNTRRFIQGLHMHHVTHLCVMHVHWTAAVYALAMDSSLAYQAHHQADEDYISRSRRSI